MELEKIKKELEGMKVKALKKRAKESGVDEERLEDVDDEEDVKGTIISLIIEQMRAGAGGADSAAELAAQQREEQLQKLREELAGLAPPSATVRVAAGPRREYAVWAGGSILASLDTFRGMWVSRDEYGEYGPQVVRRKCF